MRLEEEIGFEMSNADNHGSSMERAHRAAEIYNAIADEYDGFYTKTRDLAEDEFLRNYLKSSFICEGDVLDLGCGTGLLCQLAELDEHHYTGLDPAPRMLARARRKFPDARFIQGVAESIEGISRETIDSVVSIFGSFSYVQDVQPALAEIARVLKPGGKLMVMVYGPAHQGGSVLPSTNVRLLGKLWRSQDLQSLFSSKFSQVKVVGVGGANDLLDSLSPKDGAELLRLETTVNNFDYLNRCRWLIVTGQKNS